ncbi:UDP binding domain-containing protein [Zhongshania guokunii]|uniref:UDP-glucose 6-dehydrogenase n=1 Tax=Zhongshania guokunii TaxID=641783 RepID=A0ABV3U3W6_9GAMM
MTWCDGADALVVCTEWNAFKAPDFEVVKEHLKHPAIVDGRNLHEPDTLEAYGIAYYGIGWGGAF